MTKFTPLQYIKIAIANAYGLDKSTWKERIDFTDKILSDTSIEPSERMNKAKEPLLFIKALKAYEDAINGTPTGYMMNLDSTCSGIQIMAVLSGCHKTAKATNLINTGKVESAYQNVADIFGKTLEECKYPVMTHFYNSIEVPKREFGIENYPMFVHAVKTALPGAEEVKNDIQSCWEPALSYTWTLPDGHVAHVKSLEATDKRIEIDELDHATFTHRVYENKLLDFDVSLPANIIQSIDGYIARQVVLRAAAKNIEVLVIHDCFFGSPNHMQEIREIYKEIMIEIAKSNLLQDILREITGDTKLVYHKLSDNLSDYITTTEYLIT